MSLGGPISENPWLNIDPPSSHLPLPPPPRPLSPLSIEHKEKQGSEQGSLGWQNRWHTVCKNFADWGSMLGVHRNDLSESGLRIRK
jgi:hypothetical protein